MSNWTRFGRTLAAFSLLCAPALADEHATVVHILQRHQTLAILANLYGVPVEQIMQANPGLVPEHIPVGARIRVPAPAEGWPTCNAAPGDTLAALATRCGCSVDVLVSLNALPPFNPLGPGQAVHVPRLPDNSVPPAPATPEEPPPPVAPPLPNATWVEVRLENGARAWAPRASLLVGSPSPLDPARVVELAQRFVGAPYVWGGQTPNGVDCSGYVQQVFDLSGYRLPRLADAQFNETVPVTAEQAQPGDLVFFSTYLPGPSHVGIFLGKGRFLHASSSHGVTEGSLTDPYFAPRYLGTRRIKDWMAPPPQAMSPRTQTP